ncbi:MAG: TIGR03618 family F420-dependent PPOX class oxidoreductase [Actinobacteria bacterium]|nr:TIGR03618 family F420-dependent PPOX class oxidoreductase [Actinomycetota bacterium]
MTPQSMTPEMLAFLSDRHLATLTTMRADGSPHVVPVGFSYDHDSHTVRLITFASAVKYKNALRGGRGVVSQVDGGRWLTLEGVVCGTNDADRVAAAVTGYAARYRQPKEREDRVSIEIAVDRVMGRA